MKTLGFLSELSPTRLDDLLSLAEEQRLESGLRLAEEGGEPDALFVVLDGLCEVAARAAPNRPLSVLGPGSVVGLVEVLLGIPHSARVVVVEPARVLRLPAAPLQRRMADDLGLAAEVHRGFALTLAADLRRARSLPDAEDLASDRRSPGAGEAHSTVSNLVVWLSLQGDVGAVKLALRDADAAGREAGGTVPDAHVRRVFDALDAVIETLNSGLGASASLSERLKGKIGRMAQIEILPYLLLTRTAERMYSKPRGYAGDFKTIDLMYDDQPGGKGRLGPVLDRWFLDQPAAIAVKNRRHLVSGEIRRTVSDVEGEARVTSIACGPAREVFDAFGQLSDPASLKVTCLDVDFQALAQVEQSRDEQGLRRRIDLVRANVIYAALGREPLTLPPQHLVYSIGLIDYFKDDLVVRLLDWIHGLLAPGGRVIVGNFHPRNPSRVMADHVLEWELIHRDEADMDRLFQRSAFGRPTTAIRFEEQRINLFAECVREA